ncbi:MAG TPA: YkvA family protein [Thermoanaerobaculia bacterium]|nr:YkvA family protein [Thermoanaerobaculia bacterium]
MEETRTPDDLERSVAEEAGRGPVTEERAKRFYDRVRSSIQDFIDKQHAVIGRSAEFLLLVPDVFILLWRLTTDRRVAGKDKMLLGSAVAYFILPFDLMPEALLGPIGYMDDLIFGVYVLKNILTNTDVAVLREHWSGRQDVLDMIQSVLNAADSLVSDKVLGRLKKMVKK